MFISGIKRALRRFRTSESGTATMETVVMLPFLFVGLVMMYEFFDVFQFKNTREKATYTITDMLSRETAVVTDTYIDNTKILFDTLTRNKGVNQIRASVVRYHNDPDQNIDEFDLRWSEVRGTGNLRELTDADVKDAHAAFPNMIDGQDLILVESESTYATGISLGLFQNTPVVTRMFMNLRFAPQLCYTGVCTP